MTIPRRYLSTALIVSAGAALSGCASLASDLSSSQAQDLWGIAKGIGLQALSIGVALDPSVIAEINAAIALANAAIKAGDAAALVTQAHAVLLAAAPSVTVVPNTGVSK